MAGQVEVGNSAEVLAVMARGTAARATAETRMNARSSRSHTVLTVVVDGASSLDGTSSHGCLHLIDLAGGHRWASRPVTAARHSCSRLATLPSPRGAPHHHASQMLGGEARPPCKAWPRIAGHRHWR